MRYLVVILVTMLVCADIYAQNAVYSNEIARWEGASQSGANNPYHINTISHSRQFLGWRQDLSRILKFSLISSVVFRSPCLYDLDRRNCGVHLFTQPDITLSSASKFKFKHLKPKAFNWELKCGFNMQFNRILLFFGYELSHYSLYAGMRKNLFNHTIKDARIAHSIFVGTALRF